MALILRMTSSHSQILGADGVREFGPAGGSIGRASGNDMVLPDLDRFVSSQHAMIEAAGQDYYLVDTSTNGTYLNDGGEPVGHGNRVRLSDGDRILIGEFELTVSLESSAPMAASPADPFGQANDLDADPFGVSPAMPPSDPIAALGPPGVNPGMPQAPAPSVDPLGPSRSVDPLDDFGPEQPSAGGFLDDAPLAAPFEGTYDNDVSATGDYFQAPSTSPDEMLIPDPASPAPGAGAAIPDDWDKTSFGQAEATPRPPAAAPPQPPPQMPPPQNIPQMPVGVAPDQMAAPPGPGDLVGLRKLLETAGLDPQSAHAVANERLAETFGHILQITVRGIMDVLKSRAEIKSEFRVPLTRIRPVENNPLKFCVDVRDALYSLFAKQGGGFLPPVEAFEEGFEDIRAHQLAMMAGMRAAFDSLMERLDPENLEGEFSGDLRRTGLFKSLNKMQYWDMYREMYGEITSDADENFQRLFGDAFAKAYEEQMQRLTNLRRR
jgi:type VI secretion system FHA domain protein